MNQQECFSLIVDQIHTTVAATIDQNGLPVTCAIDIMDYNEDGLYFLTARGKSFYDRLKRQGFAAFTGLKGDNTLSCTAVSFRGKVRELGGAKLEELFAKNPYMKQLYPTSESMAALTVFQLYDGNIEWIDLSKKPVERGHLHFGEQTPYDLTATGARYLVTDRCIGCKLCYSRCPQKCIDLTKKPVVILQQHCLHCGNCFETCPAGAIEKQR